MIIGPPTFAAPAGFLLLRQYVEAVHRKKQGDEQTDGADGDNGLERLYIDVDSRYARKCPGNCSHIAVPFDSDVRKGPDNPVDGDSL
jgi:hypothetical protein